MDAALTMCDCFSLSLPGLTPVDRFHAAQGPFSGAGLMWIWIILAVAGLASVAGLVAYIVVSKPKQVAPGVSLFDTYADRAGMNREERALLARIAEQAGLKRPETIFTMEAVFERGIAGLFQSARLAEMSEQARTNAFVLLDSLREKLGFQGRDDLEAPRPQSSRQVPVGTRLSIIHQDGTGDFEAVVKASRPSELEIETEAPVECAPGDAWLARYAQAGKVWEFDAPVVRSAGKKIVLRHSEHMRFHNRRRFQRVPVRRPARVAPFPFIKPNPEQEVPEFSLASVVEVSGPGLKLEAPVSVQRDERVLVVLRLDDQKVVEGLGKVRRVFSQEEGKSVFAVELIGLRPDELAELAGGTDAAARERAAEMAASGWKESKSPSLQES